MKVLLLNPPGKLLFNRDYYCGHESKDDYYWPATDLVYLSGRFELENITYIDAIKEKRPEKILDNIVMANYDVVISMCSAISWEEDKQFLQRLFNSNNVRIFLSGDYAKAKSRELVAEHSWLEGVVTNFLICEIDKYLLNGEKVKGLETENGELDDDEKVFSTPVPHHELFLKYSYRHPLLKTSKFINFLTDYGCPYKCTFCFFERVNSKLRDIENIKIELKSLKKKGIFELFINNPSFGFNKKNAIEICNAFIETSDKFSWLCQIRADSIDEELIVKMKQAGCHTIQIGVESNDQNKIDTSRKRIAMEQTKKAFMLAKKHRIKTLAYFIIGLDAGEIEGQEKLGLYAIELGADIASFNIASPLVNTTFRDQLIDDGLLSNDFISGNVSNTSIDWNVDDEYQKKIIEIKLKNERDFYLNPKYILRQALGIRSFHQLYNYVTLGTSKLFSILFKL